MKKREMKRERERRGSFLLQWESGNQSPKNVVANDVYIILLLYFSALVLGGVWIFFFFFFLSLFLSHLLEMKFMAWIIAHLCTLPFGFIIFRAPILSSPSLASIILGWVWKVGGGGDSWVTHVGTWLGLPSKQKHDHDTIFARAYWPACFN